MADYHRKLLVHIFCINVHLCPNDIGELCFLYFQRIRSLSAIVTENHRLRNHLHFDSFVFINYGLIPHYLVLHLRSHHLVVHPEFEK